MSHRTRNIFISFTAILVLCSLGGGGPLIATQEDPSSLLVTILENGTIRYHGTTIYSPRKGSTKKLENLFEARRLQKRYQEENNENFVKYPLYIYAYPSTPFQSVQLLLMVAVRSGGVTRIRLNDIAGGKEVKNRLPRGKGIPRIIGDPDSGPIRINFCCVDDSSPNYVRECRRHRENKGRHEAVLEKEEKADLQATRNHNGGHFVLNDVSSVFVGKEPVGKLYKTWVCPEGHVEDNSISKNERVAANLQRYMEIAGKVKELSVKPRPVILDMDSATPYEHVIGVIRALKEFGIDPVEFVGNVRFFKSQPRLDTYRDMPSYEKNIFNGRIGEKRERVAAGGGGADTEDAVFEALKWLARHQSHDGSWRVKEYVEMCNAIPKYRAGGKCSPSPGDDHFQAGVTGLSILAFLGAGYTHLSKDTHDGICFGTVVKKGLKWMINNQDTGGCIGDRSVKQYMYNHLVCSLALSEAYGLTRSSLFKGEAQKAVDFTVAAQNPGKGWRYSSRSGDNDSSVTGWAVYGLHAARLSGLSVPGKSWEGIRNWFDEVTEENYYRVGYTFKGTGKVYVPGMNEQFEHHETLTAIGVVSRIFSGTDRKERVVRGGCDLMVRDLPKWEGNGIDFYYWHHASKALFQLDSPKGPKWATWNRAMKKALLPNQNGKNKGCRSGSWEAVGRWCGESGRVYATALNALTLETYYRYPKHTGKKK